MEMSEKICSLVCGMFNSSENERMHLLLAMLACNFLFTATTEIFCNR